MHSLKKETQILKMKINFTNEQNIFRDEVRTWLESNVPKTPLLSLDTKEFRKYVAGITPDIIFETEYESQIGELHTVAIPIGVGFFWPDA